jgi:hypothetical protein
MVARVAWPAYYVFLLVDSEQPAVDTRSLVPDTLRKIRANFYVVTEWAPFAGNKAHRGVNKRRRHFNICKTGLCPSWVTMRPASSPLPRFLRKAAATISAT